MIDSGFKSSWSITTCLCCDQSSNWSFCPVGTGAELMLPNFSQLPRTASTSISTIGEWFSTFSRPGSLHRGLHGAPDPETRWPWACHSLCVRTYTYMYVCVCVYACTLKLPMVSSRCFVSMMMFTCASLLNSLLKHKISSTELFPTTTYTTRGDWAKSLFGCCVVCHWPCVLCPCGTKTDRDTTSERETRDRRTALWHSTKSCASCQSDLNHFKTCAHLGVSLMWPPPPMEKIASLLETEKGTSSTEMTKWKIRWGSIFRSGLIASDPFVIRSNDGFQWIDPDQL